jgi:hypothetical protein
VRDAQPTWFEIEGEAKPAERAEAERRRNVADVELFRMYRRARASRQLGTLPLDIRQFCEGVIARDPTRAAKAMRAATGAPQREEMRLNLAVAVLDWIDSQPGPRGSVDAALKDVARKFAAKYGTTYYAVRKIHYDSDPTFRRTVEVERSRRKLERLAEREASEAERQRRRFACRTQHSKPKG